MKHRRVLIPAAAMTFVFTACASDEAPQEDVPSNDDPITTVDDGIDTNVEQDRKSTRLNSSHPV